MVREPVAVVTASAPELPRDPGAGAARDRGRAAPRRPAPVSSPSSTWTRSCLRPAVPGRGGGAGAPRAGQPPGRGSRPGRPGAGADTPARSRGRPGGAARGALAGGRVRGAASRAAGLPPRRHDRAGRGRGRSALHRTCRLADRRGGPGGRGRAMAAPVPGSRRRCSTTSRRSRALPAGSGSRSTPPGSADTASLAEPAGRRLSTGEHVGRRSGSPDRERTRSTSWPPPRSQSANESAPRCFWTTSQASPPSVEAAEPRGEQVVERGLADPDRRVRHHEPDPEVVGDVLGGDDVHRRRRPSVGVRSRSAHGPARSRRPPTPRVRAHVGPAATAIGPYPQPTSTRARPATPRAAGSSMQQQLRCRGRPGRRRTRHDR